jgi:hypothetical protein
MKFTLGVGLIASVLLLTGCYYSPVVPPIGVVFSDVKAPMDTELDSTDMGTKSGEAETCSILGLVSWGDASIEEAAKNGGLQTVKHADYEFFTVLGVYSTYTTVVYGD